MANLQLIGSCTCGRSLSSTILHETEESPFLAEAQITCSMCQKTFRIIVSEEPNEINLRFKRFFKKIRTPNKGSN